MARHDIDQDDFAAKRFYDLAPDHFLAGVVAAFDQNGRLYVTDQLCRRVLIKYDNQVNGFEGCQHLRARLHRLHWAASTFESCDRRIAIEAHNETIAGLTRASQKFAVSGMQEIEAPIREPDTQTLSSPFG